MKKLIEFYLGKKKDEMEFESEDGKLVSWTLLDLPFHVNITFDPGRQVKIFVRYFF